MNNAPELMSCTEYAAIVGEHPESVRRGIREGRIPALKMNGRWRIKRDDVFGTRLKGGYCVPQAQGV